MSHAPASSASLHPTLFLSLLFNCFSLHCPPLYVSLTKSLRHHNSACQLSLKHRRRLNVSLFNLLTAKRHRFGLLSLSMDSKKRVRDNSDEPVLESPEAKLHRDDLLKFLDDADNAPSPQDLESVMKSLQEEISGVTSKSGQSQAQIGYLLEASDDQLGLPPVGNTYQPEENLEGSELVRVAFDSSGIGELWELEDQISRYDSFDLGMGFGYECDTTEYAAFGGLFDHSDVYYYDPTEFSEDLAHTIDV